ATGTGSEIMRPLAVPMIGGVITSDAVVLLVIPVLYHMWMEWKLLPPKRPKKPKKKRGWFGKKKKLASAATGGPASRKSGEMT
ncbi:MAG: efflux RND transporter permease subunit, partial [Candidatus Brocadiales bacterium]